MRILGSSLVAMRRKQRESVLTFSLIRLAEIPPALEYSSVTVRGTCPMLGGVLMLACLLSEKVAKWIIRALRTPSHRGLFLPFETRNSVLLA